MRLAPAVGFEPTTNRLTADRSTTELRWNGVPEWERISCSCRRRRQVPIVQRCAALVRLRFRGSLRARVSSCRALFCTIAAFTIPLGRSFLCCLFLGQELFLQRKRQHRKLLPNGMEIGR